MRLKAVFALVMCASLTSCASYFLRKDCEKTDWFQYGRDVAMKGERLTGNDFIHRCEQAEADVNHVALDRGFKTGMATYCLPDTVYQIGKRGEFFNTEMCDGEQPRLLKHKHEEGVAEYCKKSNGYAAGATGKAYNGICPKGLEDAFKPEFNRGRKAYLTTQVSLNEKEIGDIDREVHSLELRQVSLRTEILTLSRTKTPTVTITNGNIQSVSLTESDETKNRKQNLQWELDRVNSEINQKQQRQESLRQKNRDFQTEMVGL